MSTAATSRPATEHGEGINPWHRRAAELAEWAKARIIVRCDRHGGYKDDGGTNTRGPLTDATIVRHFRATERDHVRGAHTTVLVDGASMSICATVDIDAHEGDGADPGFNLAYGRLLVQRCKLLGLHSVVLIDSDGKGGLHLKIFFSRLVPTPIVHAFLQWLTADHAEHKVAKLELFPKQPTIEKTTLKLGNWCRLPGRHHKRPHWSRVWDESTKTWLEGDAAIDALVACQGDDPDLIPVDADPVPEPESPRPRRPATLDDFALATEAIRFLGSSYLDQYEPWLKVGMALFKFGHLGLSLWDEWSRGSNKYEPGACAAKWATFDENGVQFGSLIAWARLEGWDGPQTVKIHWPEAEADPEPEPDAAQGGGTNGRQRDKAARPDPVRPHESSDDPHRLARVFVERAHRHADGPTIRFWQGEFHAWENGHYGPVGDKDLNAAINGAVKAEFDRINVAEIKAWEMRGRSDDQGKPSPRPLARKVTPVLVGGVSAALASYMKVKGVTRQPVWLCDDPPFPAEDVLPTRNALVHLPTLVAGGKALAAPTPLFFGPYCVDYDFDGSAPPPTEFFKFLCAIWPADPESIATLREWMGYLLTADTSQQKILMLIGPKRCGKGTIARLITAMLGQENVANPTLSSLGSHFGLSPLVGKPAAIITDARLSGRADIAQIVERLLSISGEDGQTIDRKYQGAVTTKLPTRFMLISNELPRLTETSGALSGRMLVLRLTESFYGREDLSLGPRLMGELPSILLWAIEGWRRLRERGHFVQPKSGEALVEDLTEMSSPTGMFVKERCHTGPGLDIPVQTLFRAWLEWCKEKNRDYAGDESSFGRNLRSVLPSLETKPVKETKEDGTKTYYRKFYGIALNGLY